MNQKIKLLAIICVILFSLTACINGSSQSEINEQGNASIAIAETTADIEPEEITPVEEEYIIDIQYVDNRRYEFLRGGIIEEVMYYALGEHGEYFFTPGKWTNEYMQQLIAISEDGVKFAKDWLGYEDDERVAFIYGNVEHESPVNPDSFIQKIWGGGGVMGNHEVFINMPDENMPSIIVHEAVHAVLRMQQRISNFPRSPETSSWGSDGGPMFFEEGLCNLIDYLFFLETEHIYDPYRYGSYKEAAANHLHELALIMLDIYDNFEDAEEFGLIYPQLMSYETAASFIYYLLEHKGTKEDFMRVFDDINLTEKIYGVNMDEMIEEWLEFLQQYQLA